MKKTIGKIALSFLLAFAGLCFGEAFAGLKNYGGSDASSFVLSSLQADILMISGIVIFLVLCVLGRQKEILKQQKEQLEATRALQRLFTQKEEAGFTKNSVENESAPDAPDHIERQEKRDES